MPDESTSPLDQWKAEFYPIEARDCPRSEAAAHGLRKWQGLRRENVERYGIYVGLVFLGGDTCALCHHYYNRSALDPCSNCLLVTIAGVRPCDEPYSPWKRATNGDPEPMIAALQKIVDKQREDEAMGVELDARDGEWQQGRPAGERVG